MEELWKKEESVWVGMGMLEGEGTYFVELVLDLREYVGHGWRCLVEGCMWFDLGRKSMELRASTHELCLGGTAAAAADTADQMECRSRECEVARPRSCGER